MQIKSEKEYIVSAYEKHFNGMRDYKLVIYGIGKNTKIILDNFNSDNIIGLMDEARTGEMIYGKRVISIDEALRLGVDAIVIVARASNVKIIYRRIADICIANAIDVYDINGNKIVVEPLAERSFKKYADINASKLKAKIDSADVVSFDVFDTLVMRRTLYPWDIFELAEREVGGEFAKRRIAAEHALYRECKQPTVYDIYERLGEFTPEIELRLEAEFLVRRETMCEMLRYAVNMGKKVYLVSDMYLPGTIIHGLLSHLKIEVAKESILVSCDYGVSKTNGLFETLRKKAGAGRILHIGDNLEADIYSAERHGIQDTFHIESSLSMLEDTDAGGILKYDGELSNRLMIAGFISKSLNDPFLFSRTGGRFEVNSNYDMAYSYIAPMIYCFFFWMADKARELELDLILLSARDGWLLDRIYNLVKETGGNPPSTKYFYTSRAVAVIAGIFNDEDILHAARLAYAGSPEEMLINRFHLDPSEVQNRNGYEDDEYILLHRAAILRNAKGVRDRYIRYIKSLNIPRGSKVGFFDFVSSGTCQKALACFVDFNLHGLYFARINCETEYRANTEIDAMYGNLNVFKKSCYLLENYFFMENVLTSNEATLSCFDTNGKPCFLTEQRSIEQLCRLNEIHTAILDYIRQSGKFCRPHADKAVPDMIFSFLHNKHSVTNTDFFHTEKLDDEFCNRSFDLG